MRTWKEKLSSRKFLAAVAGLVTGLAMVFGVDEAVISTIAGAVVSAVSVAAYIFTEGKVDAERLRSAPAPEQGRGKKEETP